MKLFARQGDVGFVACKIPKDPARIKVRPFALGEVTGHSHRVMVEDEAGIEMYELEGATFLRVTKDGAVSIVHEDHDPKGTTSLLPAGWEGEIRIAREYDEEQERRVMD